MTQAMSFAVDPALAGLIVKIAATAAFVIAVALLSERLGPFLGAMTASLPVYTGPVYLLVSLDHGPDYLEQMLVGSTAISAATPVFALAYCALAVRAGPGASLAAALLAWLAAAFAIRQHQWTQPQAVLLCLAVFAIAIPLAARFKRIGELTHAPKKWLDVPLRAAMVAVPVGIVTTISTRLPPMLTGILSVVPVVFSSLILVLHPRIGGAATGALMAHSIGGLVGMMIAFTVAHLSIGRIGTAPALSIGLGICVAWNLMLIFARHGLGWLRR